MTHSTEISSLLSSDLDSVFWTPELLDKPSAWWAHVPFAFWIVTSCKPRLLVELGTHYGVSYAAFCEAVVRSRLSTRCYAVDTWGGDAHAGFYGEEIYTNLKQFHDPRFGAFSELLRQKFDDAAQFIEDGAIDLLHIDGYHTYDAVRHDFETWRPKLSDRALVLFHDTNVRRDDFGVWRFFGELKQQFPSFEFLHGYGLGIALVGNNAPETAKHLCNLQIDQDCSALRECFSAVGTRWANASELNRKVSDLAAELARVGSELDARVTKQELEQTVRLRDESIAYLSARFSKLCAELHETRSLACAAELPNDISKEELQAVRTSAFFEPEYYLKVNPDVKVNNVDPAVHYLQYGGFEGRDPGPIFSTRGYLAQNPDVASSATNALVHYELHGRLEGRQPAYKTLSPERPH